MITRIAQAIAAHAGPIFAVLALGFVVAAVWTIGRVELGTTLGLLATGLAFAALEWRLT